MKNRKIINFILTGIIIFQIPLMLFAENNNNDSLTVIKEKVIEKYRLKIIGETINAIANVSTVIVDTIDQNSFNGLKKHINDKWRRNKYKKDKKFLIDLLTHNKIDSYKVNIQFNTINDTNDLNQFYKKIKKTLQNRLAENNTTKSPENKIKKFNTNAEKLIGNCKRDLDSIQKSYDKAIQKQEKEKSNNDKVDDYSKTTTKNDKHDTNEQEKEKQSVIWEIIAVLNFILIVGIYFLFFMRRKNETNQINTLTNTYSENIAALERKINNIDEQVKLNAKILAQQKFSIETEMQNVNKRINDIKNQKSITPQNQTVINTPPPPPPVIKKYAEYPDTPNGFLDNSLKDNKSSETRYEITINNSDPSRATFIYNSNKEASESAIFNARTYLKTVCEYVNSPDNNHKIRTQKEGSLIKEGNKWRVVSKARIEFYS